MAHRIIVDENGDRCEISDFGTVYKIGNDAKIRSMIAPVRCAYCGQVYDLCDVKPLARYADCTTYYTPCCQRYADDRTWVTSPSFFRIEK